jgi:hypothetical protein
VGDGAGETEKRAFHTLANCIAKMANLLEYCTLSELVAGHEVVS